MLFVSQAAAAVTAALEAAPADGKIAIIGQPRLGRSVAGGGREVVFLSSKLRSLKRTRGPAVCGDRGALPLADGALAAIVGVGVSQVEAWEALLGEWSRAVEDGGLVVLVDRAPATELSRRALCAGLTDLEQRAAGRALVVTSGVVRRV